MDVSDLRVSRDERAEVYRLQFGPDVAFDIEFLRRRITIDGAATADAELIRHHLGNQVVPRLLAHQDRLVIHSAGIAVERNGVILLVGPSGVGKSTLSASFHQAGNRLLGDDAIMIVPQATGIEAVSTYRSLRLYRDSLDAVWTSPEAWRPIMPGSIKFQALTFDEGEPAVVDAQIRSIFFLDGEPTAEVGVQPLGPSAVCVELVENSFLLDPVDTERVRRNFILASSLADVAAGFRLAFPRRYRDLPAVREAILAAHCEHIK